MQVQFFKIKKLTKNYVSFYRFNRVKGYNLCTTGKRKVSAKDKTTVY